MAPPKFERSICWIRRDLRLSDHAALAEATRLSGNVAVVFVFDPEILDALTDRNDRRLVFIHGSLREIDRILRSRGSRLIVVHGDPRHEIPRLAEELGARAVFASRDYEPAAKVRDSDVARKLGETRVEFLTLKDQVIFERREVLNGEGKPYLVFTPYLRAWLKKLAEQPEEIEERAPDLSRLIPTRDISVPDSPWDLGTLGFNEAPLWLAPGEKAGRARLERFLPRLRDYEQAREYPATEGTSGLSVHLRFGTVPVRELVRRAREHRSPGSGRWVSELVWRDFFQMILDQFPHAAEGAFRKELNRIRWPGSEAHFAAWSEGRTGYPIVDAAMRHLNDTGWMHNRLRMITASFLVKDLLVDWRKGEAYFARKLLDFDLAANNGGWQWSASTGCDAQPYFRVFNPTTQSRRFDPAGEFILEHCPELKGRAESPHDPLPAALVRHDEQRKKAIALFAEVRKTG